MTSFNGVLNLSWYSGQLGWQSESKALTFPFQLLSEMLSKVCRKVMNHFSYLFISYVWWSTIIWCQVPWALFEPKMQRRKRRSPVCYCSWDLSPCTVLELVKVSAWGSNTCAPYNTGQLKTTCPRSWVVNCCIAGAMCLGSVSTFTLHCHERK